MDIRRILELAGRQPPKATLSEGMTRQDALRVFADCGLRVNDLPLDELTRMRNMLLKRFHPDTGATNGKVAADINAAFDVLRRDAMANSVNRYQKQAAASAEEAERRRNAPKQQPRRRTWAEIFGRDQQGKPEAGDAEMNEPEEAPDASVEPEASAPEEMNIKTSPDMPHADMNHRSWLEWNDELDMPHRAVGMAPFMRSLAAQTAYRNTIKRNN